MHTYARRCMHGSTCACVWGGLGIFPPRVQPHCAQESSQEEGGISKATSGSTRLHPAWELIPGQTPGVQTLIKVLRMPASITSMTLNLKKIFV